MVEKPADLTKCLKTGFPVTCAGLPPPGEDFADNETFEALCDVSAVQKV
jgi:hypothetical protein